MLISNLLVALSFVIYLYSLIYIPLSNLCAVIVSIYQFGLSVFRSVCKLFCSPNFIACALIRLCQKLWGFLLDFVAQTRSVH